MKDMSKLTEVIRHATLSLDEDDPKKWVVMGKKLKALGAKRLRLPGRGLRDEDDLLADVIEFAQQNSDCVLYYAGYDDKGHEVFAIPKEIAEKIVVLGGVP
jgi:hypothetical protein